MPGELFAERYRIVGLLGRGGMGEVYRADDLRLGQAVALKFLPESLKDDEGRRNRFYNEVRTARQVAHAAVCRVYDVDDADGQPFLSMEYVDGEDLASLLRRIGRLPADKAVDIARQLCAGLAAAHDKGVLHRDLKPDNVMLDGRGKVRITDFGLAGLAEFIPHEDVRSGTPAYMSPEQLAGREVTSASDIYSLGLLLYELFTGRKAFEGRTLAEVLRKQSETTPASPSMLVQEIDPAVERVILRCLEKDPGMRPSSALAVAAALPGGDPLAAALAAGEIPSPEMVAAAQRARGLRPWVAGAALATVAFCLVAVPVVTRRAQLTGQVPFDKAPEALEDRARDVVRALGHDSPATDTGVGWAVDADYLQSVAATDLNPHRWDRLASGRPAAVRFWFRQSPRPMISTSLAGRVFSNNPPPLVSGMAGVDLDLQGRLLSFYAIPPQVEPPPPATTSAPDWGPLFAEARLDPARFTADTPRWTPPVHSDARAAWVGVDPVQPDVPVRVEAAAYRGRPVYFQLVGSWTRPDRMQLFQLTPAQTMANRFGAGLILSSLVASMVLARRNVRLGRGDRQGARRLAGWTLVAMLVTWALVAHHVPELGGEMSLLFRGIGLALTFAAVMWVLYLALEPYLRRGWPDALISWTRLLSGRWRDPLVGRDLLVGLAAGGLLTLSGTFARSILPQLLGLPPPPAFFERLDAMLGPRLAAAELIDAVTGGLAAGLFIILFMLVLRLLLRREWLAAPAFIALLSAQHALLTGLDLRFMLPICMLLMGTPMYLLLRLGVLPFVAALIVVETMLGLPMVSSPAHWGAEAMVMALALMAAAALYAFQTARGAGRGFAS